MKTAKYLFNKMPKPLSDMAIRYYLESWKNLDFRKKMHHYDALSEALAAGFWWARTDEGLDFWYAIYEDAKFNNL